MFMKGVFMLFLSLGLGYVLCVIAKKEKGVLKTLGYTLGSAILVLSLLYGLLAADLGCYFMGKMGICKPLMKCMSRPCPMMRR